MARSLLDLLLVIVVCYALLWLHRLDEALGYLIALVEKLGRGK
jgi:hypothetical protein